MDWHSSEIKNILSKLSTDRDGLNEEEVKKIKNAFTYHSPSQGQAGKYDDIRELGLNFALYIMAKCPDSYEAKNAITKIEEAVMWANASIARNS